MNSSITVLATGDTDAVPPLVASSHFSTRGLAPEAQVLAWRDRVGHVIDVPPSETQLKQGFGAHITRYSAGGLLFTDSSTDAMQLERSVARVSSDARRDVVFHLFLEGHGGHVTALKRKQVRGTEAIGRQVIAFDLNQPFRIDRPACRVLSLFVPRARIEAGLEDGDSIHGLLLPRQSPLAGLIAEQLVVAGREVVTLGPDAAANALRTASDLLIAGFRKSSELTGSARAAVQSAVMGQIQRFVDAHLHTGELTPTMVINALQLKRATIYRWFKHDGGLGAYIRHRRLRMAAEELVRFPHLAVMEVAYGVGFNSASDFTRAFRRAFDMSPKDARMRALELHQRAG